MSNNYFIVQIVSDVRPGINLSFIRFNSDIDPVVIPEFIELADISRQHNGMENALMEPWSVSNAVYIKGSKDITGRALKDNGFLEKLESEGKSIDDCFNSYFDYEGSVICKILKGEDISSMNIENNLQNTKIIAEGKNPADLEPGIRLFGQSDMTRNMIIYNYRIMVNMLEKDAYLQ